MKIKPMKITKQNYNELKTHELENNYAKVWHVNELATEVEVLSSSSYTPPYKSYVAEFIFNPSTGVAVTQIYNDLGATITWGVADGGLANFRIIASAPVFTNGKVMYYCYTNPDDTIIKNYSSVFNRDSNTLLYLYISDGEAPASIYVGATNRPAKIEIKVYN